MKKILKQLPLILAMTAILMLPYFVLADSPLDRLERIAEGDGQNVGAFADTNDLTFIEILGTIVNVALSLLGAIFIILIVIAGYNWMTAGGNDEKIKSATGKIKSAIIGLIITVGAYAIWSFIADRLVY